MSIYAQNYTVDEVTGEKKLVKHLNKIRVDRVTICRPSGKWNKNGKKARKKKQFHQGEKKVEYKILQKAITKEKE